MKRRPLFIFLALIIAAFVLQRWWVDYREQRDIRAALTSPNYIEGNFESTLLTEFHKKQVRLNYSLVLPDSEKKNLPLVIHILGYGGDHRTGAKSFRELQELMAENPELTMAHLYLDPSNEYGHSFFVDSQVNGPWASAILNELIPKIERRYNVGGGRLFLTGHSSGGWSALWLLLSAPERFLGVWATAPDPVDFRSFFNTDFTPGSKDNFYRDSRGNPRPASRAHSFSQREYVASVLKKDATRNEWVAYEAAFGNGDQVFNRETGELNQEVLKLWERFDIGKRISGFGDVSQLQGKIFIRCGRTDTYFLDEPTSLLCARLKELQIQSTCELIPGRHHSNLYHPSPRYPRGLEIKMFQEMTQKLDVTPGGSPQSPHQMVPLFEPGSALVDPQ